MRIRDNSTNESGATVVVFAGEKPSIAESIEFRRREIEELFATEIKIIFRKSPKANPI